MIGGCFVLGFDLKADVYTKRRSVTKSGQIEYKWQFWKEVSCTISPFSSTSFKAQATDQVFKEEYTQMSYLILYTHDPIGRNVQVTNIRRASNGEVVFAEWELKDSPPTWYNSGGSAPIFDPFGKPIEWQSLLSRAQEQGEEVV